MRYHDFHNAGNCLSSIIYRSYSINWLLIFAETETQSTCIRRHITRAPFWREFIAFLILTERTERQSLYILYTCNFWLLLPHVLRSVVFSTRKAKRNKTGWSTLAHGLGENSRNLWFLNQKEILSGWVFASWEWYDSEYEWNWADKKVMTWERHLI